MCLLSVAMAAAVTIIEKDLRVAETALARAARDVEKAAEMLGADAWLRLSDEIDAREAELERAAPL
jgi:hypothetical protein